MENEKRADRMEWALQNITTLLEEKVGHPREIEVDLWECARRLRGLMIYFKRQDTLEEAREGQTAEV